MTKRPLQLTERSLVVTAQRGGADDSGLVGNLVEVNLPASIFNIFVDSESIPNAARFKAFAVLVTTALTQQAAGQATIQPYVSLNRFAGATAATSQMPANGDVNDATTIGAAANFGPNSATIPKGLYWFSPQQLPELQWELPFVGMEFKFAGTGLTAGVMRAFVLFGPD